MGRYTRRTGWGLIRLPHARKLDSEIEKALQEYVSPEDQAQTHQPRRQKSPNKFPWSSTCAVDKIVLAKLKSASKSTITRHMSL
jgi:hypothetical protein